MEDQSVLRSPQIIARELDISPTTLRRWSEEFKAHLSDEAGAANERTHRRYTEADLTVLTMVKKLMNEGMTYQQVHQQLQSGAATALAPDEIAAEADLENLIHQAEATLNPADGALDDDADDRLMVANNGVESPALAFLTNTLSTLSDSQKSILNSQAANRELLGVLIQDNFNLKEENNRLRERILEVERELGKSRQEEEWRHEALRKEMEAKIAMVNQLATEAMNTARSIEIPEIKPVIENNPGCLGMLMGSSPKFMPMPRRKKPEAPRPPVPPSAESLSKHPKPLYPPE